MLRRILTEVFEEVVGVPREPMTPWPQSQSQPRSRGESLREAGERSLRRPEREIETTASARDEERRTRAEPARAPVAAPASEPTAGASLAASLRSPGELRRAFVLMEVLGPPVSLRERS